VALVGVRERHKCSVAEPEAHIFVGDRAATRHGSGSDGFKLDFMIGELSKMPQTVYYPFPFHFYYNSNHKKSDEEIATIFMLTFVCLQKKAWYLYIG
jgi:hypothetical protein